MAPTKMRVTIDPTHVTLRVKSTRDRVRSDSASRVVSSQVPLSISSGSRVVQTEPGAGKPEIYRSLCSGPWSGWTHGILWHTAMRPWKCPNVPFDVIEGFLFDNAMR